MAAIFWNNLTRILKQKEMTWLELIKQMFLRDFSYPSQFEREYKKLMHYKNEELLPQIRWVDRIVRVLDIDYEELFRR